MNISIETIKTGASEFGKHIKNGAKRAYNGAKECHKDMKQNIKELREELDELREVGKVHKAGIRDNDVLAQLGPATKGIENYAKENNINIIFHTPQKPYEVGSNDFEKPLTITAYKKGILNNYTTERTIDGDVNSISKVAKEKEIKIGDTTRVVKSSTEDTFLRRVYRNITEMAEEINTKREENSTGRLSGLVDEELKEEIKASNKQIREDVKDFFGMLNPFKK